MGEQRAFRIWCKKAWAASKGTLAIAFGITTVPLLVVVVIQAVALRQTYPLVSWGSVSEALGAVGTLLAVGVALWQSVVIRRQAADQLQAQRHAARVERYQRDAQTFAELGEGVGRYIEALTDLLVVTDPELAWRSYSERSERISLIEGELKQAGVALEKLLARLRILPLNPHISSAIDGIYGQLYGVREALRSFRRASYDDERIGGSGLGDLIVALSETMSDAEATFARSKPEEGKSMGHPPGES